MFAGLGALLKNKALWLGAGIAGGASWALGTGKDILGIDSTLNGPNSAAGRAAENAKQTEAFTGITTGVRGFFVGIMDFFKVLGDLFSGKISFSDMMSGKTDIKGALASADNRADDGQAPSLENTLKSVPVVGPKLADAAGIAVDNPAMTGLAAVGAASALSKATTGSINPLNLFKSAVDVADDAPKSTGIFKSAMDMLGGRGKAVIALMTAGGVAATALTSGSGSAEAAPTVPEGASVTSNETPLTEATAIGASIATPMAIAKGASLTSKFAPIVGTMANIPGLNLLASGYIASESVYSSVKGYTTGTKTASEAFANVAGGMTEAAGALGSFVTYGTGVAGREGIRAMVGEGVDKSTLRQGAEGVASVGTWLKEQFWGAANDTKTPVISAPAPAFSYAPAGP